MFSDVKKLLYIIGVYFFVTLQPYLKTKYII